MLGQVEEVELDTEAAVVAALRLFQPFEVTVQVLLRVERRPVDARQLRVGRVATPVGPRQASQLERLDRT